MYNKVELCGVNTAELPVLSEQEKRQLLTRARAGDQSARQSMIEGNLRLVLSVVQRFAQRGENLDDLFQVGCIGLIKAIDNFDPAQEVRFSTYGVPMIIGEIRRFLRDNNALRVSRSLRDTAYRAMQSREQLEKKLGREPTVEEIARQAGVELADYFARPELAVYNAIPTAEGCIGILLQQRTRTLWGAEVLVLGFGPVGQALAVRLSALGAGVTVCARRPEQRALAESLGLRASKPGGTDFAAAVRRGHRAIHALSLPAACAPETAGEAVARTVQTMLQEREGRTR